MTASAVKKEQANDNNYVCPDQIIQDIGGCGRFQVRMVVVVHLIKTIVCFAFSTMVITSAPTLWWCEDDLSTHNTTSCSDLLNTSNESTLSYCHIKNCYTANNTKCKSFGYDRKLTTAISEFNLRCGRNFIPSTINSIEISGVLLGNVLSGQIGDLIGRKPPFFMSICFIMAFNLVGFFSTSWQMFAAARFFVGVGGGFFLTTQYCLLSEFSLARWRVWIIGFPSWQIQSCLFALLAWLIHDWRYLQLMNALICIPCFFAWSAIPESFRWYIAHDKPDKAEFIIRSIAKYNKHEHVNIDKALEKRESNEDQKYTFLDMFKTKFMVKVTLLSALNWAALGVVSYGIFFGIQSLSGNIYVNLFLFSLTGIPSKSIALWLQNRFGRRATSIMCFVVVAIGGFVVGIVQTLDVPHKNILTNAFALFANMGISTAWGPIQTMTIELYPTVIRNIGFGTLSVTGRIGSILGPQLVYLNMYIPGLLYYVCGVISVACTIGLLFLPETMDANLNDKIERTVEIVKSETTAKTKNISIIADIKL